MNMECKIKQCHLCNERCPQAETANDIALGRMHVTKELIACQKELEAYRAIGTPDECKEAVEKQKAKKPAPIDYKKYMDVVKNAKILKGAFWCPNCNHAIRSGDYCNDCGQKIDWSVEE